MKLRFSLVLILASLLSMVVTTSCEKNDEPTLAQFTSLVTFYSGTPTSSLFELVPPNDGTSIFLSASPGFTENMPTPGQRMLITYETADNKMPEASCRILLRQSASIETLPITTTTEPDTLSWRAHGIYATSLWRTGFYLNLEAGVPSVAGGHNYQLVLDESTLENDIPTAYLYDLAQNLTVIQPNYANYASFNIISVWNRVNNLRVVFYDVNSGSVRETTFEKGR